MNFELKKWYEHRANASILGEYIQGSKDNNGIRHLERETLDGYVAHITCILKECSNYMDKCGLTMPAALWKYKHDDITTHPSNRKFKYEGLMNLEQIRAYGVDFMSR